MGKLEDKHKKIEPIKLVQVTDKQQTMKDILFDENKEVIDTLEEKFEIKVPMQDPTKLSITYKEGFENKYQPTFDSLWLFLRTKKINVSKDVLRTILRAPEYMPPYNPIADYFESIRGKWTGESQIDLFCKHLTPRAFEDHDPEYYTDRMNKLIRKWLVASVAMWMGSEPNPVALGFIHAQEGIGKTRLIKFLTPKPLEEFYIESSRDDAKFDMEESFARYMFVNFDELVGINKRNIDTWKSILTKNDVLVKFRHEEFATPKQRIAAALFSSNRTEEMGGFLHQSFGYRRWGAIEIESIDFEYSNVVDVDQLWSEALMLYESSNFDFIFHKETDFAEFAEYNKRYNMVTPAMRFVQRLITMPTMEQIANKDERIQRLNATAIFELLKHKIRAEEDKAINQYSIGAALKALNFEAKAFRPEGSTHPIYGYDIILN